MGLGLHPKPTGPWISRSLLSASSFWVAVRQYSHILRPRSVSNLMTLSDNSWLVKMACIFFATTCTKKAGCFACLVHCRFNDSHHNVDPCMISIVIMSMIWALRSKAVILMWNGSISSSSLKLNVVVTIFRPSVGVEFDWTAIKS